MLLSEISHMEIYQDHMISLICGRQRNKADKQNKTKPNNSNYYENKILISRREGRKGGKLGNRVTCVVIDKN